MSLLPFDDRDGWIWLDGQFVPWREAKVHVLTHGLHYASAVFEGERMYGGEIYKLTEHTERLFKSAEILDFEIPFTVAEIDQVTQQNAAMVEESTAASHALASEAVELARLMGQFTIGQDNDRSTVRKTAAPPRAQRPSQTRGYSSGAATAAKYEPVGETDSWEEF